MLRKTQCGYLMALVVAQLTAISSTFAQNPSRTATTHHSERVQLATRTVERQPGWCLMIGRARQPNAGAIAYGHADNRREALIIALPNGVESPSPGTQIPVDLVGSGIRDTVVATVLPNGELEWRFPPPENRRGYTPAFRMFFDGEMTATFRVPHGKTYQYTLAAEADAFDRFRECVTQADTENDQARNRRLQDDFHQRLANNTLSVALYNAGAWQVESGVGCSITSQALRNIEGRTVSLSMITRQNQRRLLIFHVHSTQETLVPGIRYSINFSGPTGTFSASAESRGGILSVPLDESSENSTDILRDLSGGGELRVAYLSRVLERWRLPPVPPQTIDGLVRCVARIQPY